MKIGIRKRIREKELEKKSGEFVPSRGDIVWISFNPQAGSEQSGHRPAICISHQEYNKKTGLGIFCPITSKVKNYPFEIPVHVKGKIDGVILSDHVKSLDWKARGAGFLTKAPKAVLENVVEFIALMIMTEE